MAAMSKKELYMSMLKTAVQLDDDQIIELITNKMNGKDSISSSAGNSSHSGHSNYAGNSGHAGYAGHAGNAGHAGHAGNAGYAGQAGHAGNSMSGGRKAYDKNYRMNQDRNYKDKSQQNDNKEHTLYVRFECRDGDTCSNERCKFIHSSAFVIGDNSVQCKFGETCNKKTCTFIHRHGDLKQEENHAADV